MGKILAAGPQTGRLPGGLSQDTMGRGCFPGLSRDFVAFSPRFANPAKMNSGTQCGLGHQEKSQFKLEKTHRTLFDHFSFDSY